jgi:hypothetical protein
MTSGLAKVWQIGRSGGPVDGCTAPDLDRSSALGGTRTPNLLIRSEARSVAVSSGGSHSGSALARTHRLRLRARRPWNYLVLAIVVIVAFGPVPHHALERPERCARYERTWT